MGHPYLFLAGSFFAFFLCLGKEADCQEEAESVCLSSSYTSFFVANLFVVPTTDSSELEKEGCGKALP